MRPWIVAAAAIIAAVLLIVGACIRISADRPGRTPREPSIRKFLLMGLIFLSFFAALALSVAVLLSDRLDIIRITKDTSLPETVKSWLWGWK